MRIAPVLALLLVACGGAGPPSEGPEHAGETMPEQSNGVSLRAELPHPEMRAGSNPDVDADARLEPILYVVNGTDAEVAVSTMTYAAFQLDWAIEAEDGARFDVTFLPPPVPPPGGIPPRELSVPPGGEAELNRLFGVSGYHRRDDPPPDGEWLRVLPPGTYRVTVGGVRLSSGEVLSAPPVTLTVR